MVKKLPSNAGDASSMLGQGAAIPHVSKPQNQNIKKQKQYCNKFNKDFKMVHIKKNLLKMAVIKDSTCEKIKTTLINGPHPREHLTSMICRPQDVIIPV